ncbi:uncharacterized protein KY384_008929 [Bacidia gigantensis]|uniref:uncharacterized protein n=1 Tax=Bacidia gigantensis TaxID=2732470 RepID=UPI001D038D32|nr:uncharacterized protein KY384_008929 [Bacidia gigantensis]KAG8525285.1 hypothetical protein KY384_008929 [Bacidia gigantensis]
MIALMQKQRPARYSVAWDPKGCQACFVLFTLIFFFVFSWSIYLPGVIHGPPLSELEAVEETPIRNATLGFEKIFALALPDRKDRVRPLLDAANATNITITVLNAVRDSEISETGKPKNWPGERHRAGELGCLVSHVRTWNKMVANNISSALIMESDADWDLRIASILQPLPRAISRMVDFASWPRLPTNNPNDAPDVPPSPSPNHPYGLNWDILWLGHCGSNNEGTSRIYSWNDSSVPPENKEFVFDNGLNADQHIPGTRALYQFQRTTCSTAYAITLPGAKKLAKYFKEADNNLDLELSGVCARHADMVCLAVWPQVITACQSDSNIAHSGAGDIVNTPDDGDGPSDVKAGPALQFSARKNAERIMRDGKGRDDWKSQWDTMWAPGEPLKEDERKEAEEEGADGGGKEGGEKGEEEKGKARKDGMWVMVKLNRTAAFQEGCAKDFEVLDARKVVSG